jgi:hypothetical protein
VLTKGTPAAFSALGFLLVVLTKGTPAAFSAPCFPLVVLTQGTPAAFSALGFLLVVLTQGTPAAFSALGFQLVVLVVLTIGTPATLSAISLLLSMLTNALTWTFSAEVSIPYFPMRTPFALCHLLFWRLQHVYGFASRSLHDCLQVGMEECGLDHRWTAPVLVLWSTRDSTLWRTIFNKRLVMIEVRGT